jgi:hypothetical protein
LAELLADVVMDHQDTDDRLDDVLVRPMQDLIE